jgi:hypothetical protein
MAKAKKGRTRLGTNTKNQKKNLKRIKYNQELISSLRKV